MKQAIRRKAVESGVDLVGFLNLKDYKSPRSPDPHRYLPTATTAPAIAPAFLRDF